LKRIALARIARVMQLSEDWLQGDVNRCHEVVPRTVQVQPKEPRRLAVQMDELWSFVDHKGNKQWVWLALDVATREMAATSATVLERLLWHCGNHYQESSVLSVAALS
jgi:insertion element IS1 protein InsB